MRKTVAQRVEQVAQPRNRKAAAAQVGERLQFQDVERRVAALGVTAGLGLL
jgi:hypothetical protein